jgi:hypothetical protein
MNSHNAVIFSDWSVLSFNGCGINSALKGNDIRCAIRESRCDMLSACRKPRRSTLIRLTSNFFAPVPLIFFAFVPSMGNSGGSITVWNSSKLVGNVIYQNEYALSVEFFSNSSNESWIITNIYAPCTPHGKLNSSFGFPI